MGAKKLESASIAFEKKSINLGKCKFTHSPIAENKISKCLLRFGWKVGKLPYPGFSLINLDIARKLIGVVKENLRILMILISVDGPSASNDLKTVFDLVSISCAPKIIFDAAILMLPLIKISVSSFFAIELALERLIVEDPVKPFVFTKLSRVSLKVTLRSYGIS